MFLCFALFSKKKCLCSCLFCKAAMFICFLCIFLCSRFGCQFFFLGCFACKSFYKRILFLCCFLSLRPTLYHVDPYAINMCDFLLYSFKRVFCITQQHLQRNDRVISDDRLFAFKQ